MTGLAAGAVYTKQGIDVIVHFVKDGWVYGVKYREGGSDASLYLPPDECEIPADCLGTFRMPVADFWVAVAGAKVVGKN